MYSAKLYGMELEPNFDAELVPSNDVNVELPTNSSSSPLHLHSDHSTSFPLPIFSHDFHEDVKPDVAAAREVIRIIRVKSLSVNSNYIESKADVRCYPKNKPRIGKKRFPRNTQKCRSNLTKIKIQSTSKSKSVLNSSVNRMQVISLNKDKTYSDFKRQFKLKNCFIKLENIRVSCQGTYPEKQECAEPHVVSTTNAIESENIEISSKIKCSTDIQSVNYPDDDDPDEEMDSETLAELERRYNLNEFSYDITIIPDLPKHSRGDGENQKRTRSGRIVKTPAKIRTQEVKESAAVINDIDREGDKTSSESSPSDPGSDSDDESDSNFQDSLTEQQKKPKIPRKIPNQRTIRKTDRAGNMIEPKFKCDTCTKQFFSNRELLRHINVHADPEDRPSFKCSHCDKTYTTKSHCRTHEETHDPSYDKNKRFPCPVCDQSFSDRARFRQHTRSAHNIAPSFKCDYSNCNRRFRNYEFLQCHVTTDHLGVRPFSCSICKRDFKTQKSLTLHRIHKHSTSKDHVCCFCGKGYRCAQSLKNHEKLHSPSYVPPLPILAKSVSDKPKNDKLCNLCGAVLRGKDSMEKHMRLIHDRNPYSDNEQPNDDSFVAPSVLQKQFVCKYCEESFVLRSTMVFHQQKEHPEKFQFQCEECKFGASSMYLINHHKLTKHSTARNFKCPLCGNGFKAPKDLSRHMKAQHPVSKDHKCPECDAAFAHKHKLKEHALKAHRKVLVLYGRKLHATKAKAKVNATTSSTKDYTYGANPSTAFNCEICNRKYASELVLRRHNIKFHGAKNSSEGDVEDFKCDKCKSVFTCKKNLVYHQKIHDEEYVKKRLTCFECGRTFCSPDVVRKHIEYTHSKETMSK